MNPSLDAAWRDLNRRSTLLWWLLFGAIPGMFLLAYLLNDLLLQEAPLLTLALQHQQERVGREARRVPHARRAVDDLAFAHERNLLRAVGLEVVQVHLA